MQNFRQRFRLKEDRWIYVPTLECVEVGKRIKSAIEAQWKIPNYFFHLRPGGHVNAMRVHLDSRYFAKLDLANFFGSIGLSRVTRVLKRFALYDQARSWANWSVVRPTHAAPAHLPFGFVQSPILASIALDSSVLGRGLRTLAHSKNSGVIVSVYVDDILLSSDDERGLSEAFYRLTLATEKSRFTVNELKMKGPDTSLQAFNIHLRKDEMRVTGEKMKVFESILLNGATPSTSQGILSYIKSVNPGQAAALSQALGVC